MYINTVYNFLLSSPDKNIMSFSSTMEGQGSAPSTTSQNSNSICGHFFTSRFPLKTLRRIKQSAQTVTRLQHFLGDHSEIKVCFLWRRFCRSNSTTWSQHYYRSSVMDGRNPPIHSPFRHTDQLHTDVFRCAQHTFKCFKSSWGFTIWTAVTLKTGKVWLGNTNVHIASLPINPPIKPFTS